MGKSKVISELMWLRSTENAPTWNSPNEQPFHEWWGNEEQQSQRVALVELTAAHLAPNGNGSTPALKSAIESAFDVYVQGSLGTKRNRSRTLVVRVLLQVASRWLPDSVKTRLKRAFARSAILRPLSDLTTKGLFEAAAELQRTGVVVDHAQLKLIENSIWSSHKAYARAPRSCDYGEPAARDAIRGQLGPSAHAQLRGGFGSVRAGTVEANWCYSSV